MSGGGKGGSQSQTVKLPKEIEEAAKRNLGIANEVAALGYVPYSGPTVADFTPSQRAAMQNTQDAAAAFGMGGAAGQAQPGMDPLTGMSGQPVTVGGVTGFSPMGLYENAKANIAPGQRAMIDSFSINPMTGAGPTNPSAAPVLFGQGGGGGGRGGGGGKGGKQAAGGQAIMGAMTGRRPKSGGK